MNNTLSYDIKKPRQTVWSDILDFSIRDRASCIRPMCCRAYSWTGVEVPRYIPNALFVYCFTLESHGVCKRTDSCLLQGGLYIYMSSEIEVDVPCKRHSLGTGEGSVTMLWHTSWQGLKIAINTTSPVGGGLGS